MIVAELLAWFTALAAPDRLPPVNQCHGDAEFVAFHAELVRVAERRDVAALMAMLDDAVLVDFGPDGEGKAAFAQAWRLDRADQSGLWHELKTILHLGCTMDHDVWSMPSLKLDSDVDPLTFLVAIEPGSAMRSEPSDDASIVARLNWHLLTFREATADRKWLRVSLRDGRTGYVRPEQVRSPLDYRMGVQRISGRLRITAFVAGD